MAENQFTNKAFTSNNEDKKNESNVGYEKLKDVNSELNKGFENTKKVLEKRETYLIAVTKNENPTDKNNDPNIVENNSINSNNTNTQKKSHKYVNDTGTNFDSRGNDYAKNPDFTTITRRYVNVDDSNKQNETYVGDNEIKNQHTYSKLEHSHDEKPDDEKEQKVVQNDESHRYTSLLEDKNVYNENSIYEEEIEKKENQDGKDSAEVEIYEFAHDVAPPKRELPAIPYDYVVIIPSEKNEKKSQKRKIIILAIASIIFLIAILGLGLGLGLGLKNESNKRKYAGGTMIIVNSTYPESQRVQDVIKVTTDCLKQSVSFSSNFINIAVPATTFKKAYRRYVTIFTMQGSFEIEKLSHYLLNVCYLNESDKVGFMECLEWVDENYTVEPKTLPCQKYNS